MLLDQSMAGRQSLSFGLVVDSGLVAAGMKSSGPTDVAMSEAVAGEHSVVLCVAGLRVRRGHPSQFTGRCRHRLPCGPDSTRRHSRRSRRGNAGCPDPVSHTGRGGGRAGSGIVVSAVEPMAAAIVYSVDEVRAVAPGIAGAPAHGRCRFRRSSPKARPPFGFSTHRVSH